MITSTASTLNLKASLNALRRPDRNGEEISFRSEKIISFEAMQKQYIIEALKRTGGKVTGPGGAAELLYLNGRTLMSKMNKLGIDRNKFTGLKRQLERPELVLFESALFRTVTTLLIGAALPAARRPQLATRRDSAHR